MRYTDAHGNEWDSAEEAIEEFLSELPDLDEEETETVFQFTSFNASAAFNLKAIAEGITYAGMHDKFDGYPVPVPNI